MVFAIVYDYEFYKWINNRGIIFMTKNKQLSDEEIECILTPLSILAHMGFKCVTKDGEDLTEDLKKIREMDLE